MKLDRPCGNKIAMVARSTRVGSVDQVPPQRAERGFFYQLTAVPGGSTRSTMSGEQWVRVTVGDRVKN